jgi:hypothetical protein
MKLVEQKFFVNWIFDIPSFIGGGDYMLKLFTIILKIVLVLSAIFWIANSINDKTEPQQELEYKAREQAREYLDSVFKNELFVIKEMTFDSSHQLYDYAAIVENEANNIEFRVFLNNNTGKMDDDYVEMKWKDDLTDDLLPFINENFAKGTSLFVGYEECGLDDFNIDPKDPGDYKDFEGKPSIYLSVQHPKTSEDKKENRELLDFLKNKCGLKHAFVSVAYYKNYELLMGEEWFEEF